MKAKIRIPSSKEICRKGNGRIFVQSEEDIQKVIDTLREIDEAEYQDYFPKDFISVFKEDRNYLVYTGKFDVDVDDLILRCQKKDVYIIVISCNEYQYDDSLTLERYLENKIGLTYVSDFVYNKTK